MFSPEDLIFPLPENRLEALLQGANGRSVLVLAREEDTPEAGHLFLSRILAAARVNLEQDTLFAWISGDEKTALTPVLKSRAPRVVLVFGCTPASLGLAFEPPQYQPFEFYGATWLWADALSALEPDKNKKTLLWRALQLLFPA